MIFCLNFNHTNEDYTNFHAQIIKILKKKPLFTIHSWVCNPDISANPDKFDSEQFSSDFNGIVLGLRFEMMM